MAVFSNEHAGYNVAANFNQTRLNVVFNDRRFSVSGNHLLLEGVDLFELGRRLPTPLYVFSEAEILRNIAEIRTAFSGDPNTEVYYASKACSVLRVLRTVRESGLSAEANSEFEVRKCLEAGFQGSQIIWNGVLKRPSEIEYALLNGVYSINVDSEYELDLVGKIASRLGVKAGVSIRVEPSVPSPTHPGSVASYRCKAGLDLRRAEAACRRALEMESVKLLGLHVHVGDQVPTAEPFMLATRRVVAEAARIEKALGIRFELINLGGGIPVPYKYGDGDPEQDFMYTAIGPDEFARAIVEPVREWRKDIKICIEPGRKVVGSAGVLLTTVGANKTKAWRDKDLRENGTANWLAVDAGYSILSDSLHFDWFFYLLNAGQVLTPHDRRFRIGGPLCDAGDYFHQGVDGEQFLLPHDTAPGHVLTFIDVGAYTIETQTTYNMRPRTAAYLINTHGQLELIRRQETYEEMVAAERS